MLSLSGDQSRHENVCERSESGCGSACENVNRHACLDEPRRGCGHAQCSTNWPLVWAWAGKKMDSIMGVSHLAGKYSGRPPGQSHHPQFVLLLFFYLYFRLRSLLLRFMRIVYHRLTPWCINYQIRTHAICNEHTSKDMSARKYSRTVVMQIRFRCAEG